MGVPILIVDISGNVKGTENWFCSQLADRLRDYSQVTKVDRRGQELLDLGATYQHPYEIVVVVAHAYRTHGGAEPVVDIGIEDKCTPEWVKAQLRTPDILMQLLRGNPSEYVLVYCACEAYTPGALAAAAVHDPNCQAVVACEDKPNTGQVGAVYDVVNAVRRVLDGDDRRSLYGAVAEAVEAYGGSPAFVCLDVPRIELT